MAATGSRKPAVGGTSSRSPWYPIFIASLIAVAGSFLLFVFVAADSFGGDEGGGTPPPVVDATASDDATAEPTGAATGEAPTTQATAVATATPNPSGPPASTGDTSPLVTCGDILAPLNKGTRLADDCAPNDLETLAGEISTGGSQELRAETHGALKQLFAAALKDGHRLYVASSYRSYRTQVDTFQYHVNNLGIVQAERISARPGHSEHQMGTTADVTSASAGFGLDSFAGTAEAAWIEANSWRFGFVVSYPSGTEGITGYSYEPWHIRFVGVDAAKRVEESGKTLHEFLSR